jgi:hypothetical protein
MIPAIFTTMAGELQAIIEQRNRGLVPADMDLVVTTLNHVIRMTPSDFSDKDRETARDWLENIENPRRARRTGQAAAAHNFWLAAQGLDASGAGIIRGQGRFGRKLMESTLSLQKLAETQAALLAAAQLEAKLAAQSGTVANVAATKYI